MCESLPGSPACPQTGFPLNFPFPLYHKIILRLPVPQTGFPLNPGKGLPASALPLYPSSREDPPPSEGGMRGESLFGCLG